MFRAPGQAAGCRFRFGAVTLTGGARGRSLPGAPSRREGPASAGGRRHAGADGAEVFDKTRPALLPTRRTVAQPGAPLLGARPRQLISRGGANTAFGPFIENYPGTHIAMGTKCAA